MTRPRLISSQKKRKKKPEPKPRRGASFTVSLAQFGNVSYLEGKKSEGPTLSIDEEGNVKIEDRSKKTKTTADGV